ncbi:MAG: serine/threonine protein kinase [Deltaproteobacteria bacterium]|nr:serine/threonine protein kinase [Deltaproteobacteria bacterium]
MGTAPRAPKEPAAIKIGDLVLDRYRVVEQIASGGHSVVFRGLDERLSRPVCIKVFSGLGGKSGVGRTSYEHFVQEAFALSRLTHPNTLRIYDFGHLGDAAAAAPGERDGMPLQVCEFMNGGTLSQVIREQGRQSLEETARVVGAMCAALGEAHALGIVHRDIKPQNILFGAVGTNKLPKLADFGIAKWSADSEQHELAKRAEDTAIVAGQKLAMYSPSWAAPEQLAGQPVSAATDIYSLAVVAVYMLSAKAIFADEDVYAGYKKRRHADELIRDALLPQKVPMRVIALLTRALAFDPKKRLTKVEELATGLATALEADAGEERRPAQEPTAALQPVTPTIPELAITPPVGTPTVAKRGGNTVPPPIANPAPPAPPAATRTTRHSVPPPIAAAAAAPVASADIPPVVAPQAAPLPPAIPHPQAAPGAWQPPQVRTPWMANAPLAGGAPVRLALADTPVHVGQRNVHFILSAPTTAVDLLGGQGKVRITFIAAPNGHRILHLKGLSCFVAHLGGRPSPAVTLDQPGDVALVTPRAQEIGHIRVVNGVSDAGSFVFPLGAALVAVSAEDCSDPILFDFGPGSDAYFVYTRGRAIPVSTSRRR